jgi:hypothetical protein
VCPCVRGGARGTSGLIECELSTRSLGSLRPEPRSRRPDRVARVCRVSLSRDDVRRLAAAVGSPACGASEDTEAASHWTEFRSTVSVERCRACICACPVFDRGRSRRGRCRVRPSWLRTRSAGSGHPTFQVPVIG